MMIDPLLFPPDVRDVPDIERLFSLAGKTAVVTGAAGLLGHQHCRALAFAGATVIATDLSESGCNQTIQSVKEELLGKSERSPSLPEATHPGLIAIAADITEPRSLESLRDAISERCGTIDVLVNNAAVNDAFENPLLAGELSRFENYPLEMWKRSMDVNVTGLFLASQIIGTAMARSGGGSIINIASTYGLVAPDQSIYRKENGEQTFFKSPAYPTTKGAVLSFTRYLASWWGNAGVRVNALVPGGVENGQDGCFIRQYRSRTPLGRMADATDYHGALIYLASDASSYMTGASLVVDGGYTCW